MIPTGAQSAVSPFAGVGTQLFNFGRHAYHRVLCMDEMMVLDVVTLIQFNKLKATHLMKQIAPLVPPVVVDHKEIKPPNETIESVPVADCCVVDSSSDEIVLVVFFPSVVPSPSKRRRKRKTPTVLDRCVVDGICEDEIEVVLYSPTPPVQFSTNVDVTSGDSDFLTNLSQEGCVLCTSSTGTLNNTPWEVELASAPHLIRDDRQFVAMANGPTTILEDDVLQLMGLFGDSSSVFMNFPTKAKDKQPVIFDTGASLAITFDKTDFDGPLTVPKGDLRLGGMANGLKIEGVGSVT